MKSFFSNLRYLYEALTYNRKFIYNESWRGRICKKCIICHGNVGLICYIIQMYSVIHIS